MPSIDWGQSCRSTRARVRSTTICSHVTAPGFRLQQRQFARSCRWLPRRHLSSPPRRPAQASGRRRRNRDRRLHLGLRPGPRHRAVRRRPAGQRPVPRPAADPLRRHQRLADASAPAFRRRPHGAGLARVRHQPAGQLRSGGAARSSPLIRRIAAGIPSRRRHEPCLEPNTVHRR